MKEKTESSPLIIVTGAAGMIGSGVVRHLNDLGQDNLLLVDNLESTDKWKNLLGKRFSHYIGIQDLFSWLEGREDEVEAVIHLGACSDTLETNGDYLMENNYRYTVKLAEYSLNHDIRFIYASSAATYGDGALGFSDDHDGLQELRPLNLYGFSKHLFDLWAQKEGVLDQLVGLKYFNVFGPNEDHKGRMSSMVAKMHPVVQSEGVLQLFKSNDPVRFADGDQSRDFIYVKDAVRITCDFLKNRAGGIFNVGMGSPTTWNSLATHVFDACKQPVNIQYVDMPESLSRQYQNYTCAETKKLENLFGRPDLCQFSMKEAVSEYVKAYLGKGERW